MPSIPLDLLAGSTKPRSGHNTLNTGHSKSSRRHRKSEDPTQKTGSSHSNGSRSHAKSGEDHDKHQKTGKDKSHTTPSDKKHRLGHKRDDRAHRKDSKTCRDHTINSATATTLPDESQAVTATRSGDHGDSSCQWDTTPSKEPPETRSLRKYPAAPKLLAENASDQLALVSYNGNIKAQGHMSKAVAARRKDTEEMRVGTEVAKFDNTKDDAPGQEWAATMGLYALFFESENPLELKANEALTKNYGLSWTAWSPIKLNSRHSSLEVIDGEETANCRFLSVRAGNTDDLLIQTWLWQAAMLFHHQSSREGRLQAFTRSSEGCSKRFKHYDTCLRFCNLINTICLDGCVIVALSDNKSKIPQVVGAIEIEYYTTGMRRDPVVSPPDFRSFFRADKLAELEHYQKYFKEKLLKSDKCAPVWCKYLVACRDVQCSLLVPLGLRDFAVQDGLQFEALESDLMECFTQPAEKEPVARVTFMDFRNDMA
ncbi:uncharacterized protein PG986_008550 [Apiospora aurea]|uniref:Uncharacterized protein n=1 Tax=Apiospora aurea TaxID=335848 RepID=A0ABR1QFS2_9PEZI